VEEVLVEARSRDIQLDDGDYFKIIIALCQNKMAAQAQVPYLSHTGGLWKDITRSSSAVLRFRDPVLFLFLGPGLRISDPLGIFLDYKFRNFII
jgi:hypothetical protein